MKPPPVPARGNEGSGRSDAGFGHRYHTKDPRTARLFDLAGEAGIVEYI